MKKTFNQGVLLVVFGLIFLVVFGLWVKRIFFNGKSLLGTSETGGTPTVAHVQTNEGSVTGTVLLGPTCPNVQNPDESECADKPYQANLILVVSGQTKAVREFSSDANGEFTLSVKPGTYEITSAPRQSILPNCQSNSFRVIAGRTVDVAVSCDSGIR